MTLERFFEIERRAGVRRTLTLVWALWVTWAITDRAWSYLEHVGKDPAAIAAAGVAIGAVLVPVSTVTGFICRWYFAGKKDGQQQP